MTTLSQRTITVTLDQAASALLIIVAVTAVLLALAAAVLPPAIDWSTFFMPALRELQRGGNPYQAGGFYNPPWALLPLIPFSFNEELGRAGLFIVSAIVFVAALRRLDAPLSSVVLFFLSPLTMLSLFNGNLEFMVLAAVLLPPRWGLLLAVIKPQVGLGLCVFWGVEAWREGGVKKAVALILPTGIAFVLSVVLFGWWPGTAKTATALSWNASVWPWGIPAGLAVLGWSLWRRKIQPSLAAGALLSPYISMHSYTSVIAALADHPRWIAVTDAVLWGYILMKI